MRKCVGEEVRACLKTGVVYHKEVMSVVRGEIRTAYKRAEG